MNIWESKLCCFVKLEMLFMEVIKIFVLIV